MGTNKKYWKGIEELQNTPSFQASKEREFQEDLPVDEFLGDEDKLKETSTARRDFLKFMGFSIAAATIASCETPVIKSIPYVNKPEDVTPGVANWYASTYYDGNAYASILIKTREARPIHIKGNRDHGFTKGSVNPRIAASVLSLYDSERLQGPHIDGDESSQKELDEGVVQSLQKTASAGKKIVVLSRTIMSPSTMTAIQMLKSRFGGGEMPNPEPAAVVDTLAQDSSVAMDTTASENVAVAGGSDVLSEMSDNGTVEHIMYDAVGYDGIRKANKASFGKAAIPHYDFSKAKTIVSIGADFLNDWLLSTEYTAQYSETRKPDNDWMSKHYQFETNMSVAGSNADVRGMIKPSQRAAVADLLLKEIKGSGAGVSAELSESVVAKVKAAAADLKANKGASLVVSGSNNEGIQTIVNAINDALGNYGKTIDLNNEVNLFQGDEEQVQKLIGRMGSDVGAVILYDTNPVYTLPNGAEFKEALSKVTAVSLSGYMDETASACKYVSPAHHSLESWNDYNPKKGHYAIQQPAIRPLYKTTAPQESLMVWAGQAQRQGKESMAYYELIKNNWIKFGYPMAKDEFASAEDYWNNMVHYSCSDMPVEAKSYSFSGNLSNAAKLATVESGDWEVQVYQKPSMGVGQQAGNPWLQEMPDPITKVTWDNYATMSLPDMREKGYAINLDQEHPASMITVSNDGAEYTLPVYPQPGQTPGTIGIALGYGRGENGEAIGKAAYHTGEYGGYVSGENGDKMAIGVNAFKLLAGQKDNGAVVSISDAGKTYPLAVTQIHHTVMGRDSIIRETSLSVYKAGDKNAYNEPHTLATHVAGETVHKNVNAFDMWDEHPVEHIGHRWGMSIDLNQCFGCGSCLIACQSENNVPVVGKDEVRRGREMHWLRLDRYYASDGEEKIGERKEDMGLADESLFHGSDNPKVVHMPMMCHHCNHAPCETVCPVAATTHSNEGLNQMTYNRCIGTRYCANNCPYKVRRFNWFNYPSYKKFTEVNPAQDDLGRMVLNPDVVVRTRGVMEKCSFCVQKIQAGKLEAKKEGRPVKDGDVTTACADVCPADAIIVGDWNDENSAIRKVSEHDRSYQVLEEIGVKPNIWYQTKVRNVTEEVKEEEEA